MWSTRTCQIWMKLKFLIAAFSKIHISQNFILWEPSCSIWTDGWMNRYDKAIAFRSFATCQKKKPKTSDTLIFMDPCIIVQFTKKNPTRCNSVSEFYYTVPDNVHQLHVQQPTTYEKPEVASAVLGSWWWVVCRPNHVELHINTE